MSLTTTPAVAVAGSSCTVASSLTGSNIAVVSITSVPVGSKVSLGLVLLSKPAAGWAIPGFTGNAGNATVGGTPPTPGSATDAARQGLATSSFTPDVAGPYGVTVYTVRHIPPLPTFQGDTLGDDRWDVAATDAGTVHVAGDVELPITTIRGDGAALRLRIANETVQGAYLVRHRNDRSRVAALDAGVVAALAALVGQTVAGVGPVHETTVTALRTAYEAHRILTVGPVHANADNVNTVPRTETVSVEGSVALCGALYDALVGHLTGSSSHSPGWHKDASGTAHDDLKNLPIAPKPENLQQLIVCAADLRHRVYARHIGQISNPASHANPDATNTIVAATLLDSAIVAYLDALAAENPTAPTGKPTGIVRAQHLYGFASPPDITPPVDVTPPVESPPDI